MYRNTWKNIPLLKIKCCMVSLKNVKKNVLNHKDILTSFKT